MIETLQGEVAALDASGVAETAYLEGLAKAGTLGAVIGVAQGLGVKGALVSSGTMKVEGNPALATVKLETGGALRAFTLTKLAWKGDERVAQVHDEGPSSKAELD